VELIDHQDSRFLWDLLQLETIRQEALDALTSETVTVETVKASIHQCFRKTADIVMQRNRRFKQIETELYEKEKSFPRSFRAAPSPPLSSTAIMWSPIGTMPLEVLTGYSADDDGGNPGSLEALSEKRSGRSWPT
jgi:hypothetical protein